MTRAERYKRNYRLIKNAYNNAVLAKRAQTWSDERIYNELGVKITKSTPKLKVIPKEKNTYYERKLKNFLYARELDIPVKEAKALTTYRKKKIASTADYLDSISKKRVAKNTERRIKLWRKWSANNNKLMPPAIEREAVELNRKMVVGGKQLDDDAHYGYMAKFYMYTKDMTYDEIKDLVSQDPHDEYKLIYKTEVTPI